MKGKSRFKLKRQTALKLHEVKCLIIDKSLVIRHNKFGWVDRCLRQVTGKLDVQFDSTLIK